MNKNFNVLNNNIDYSIIDFAELKKTLLLFNSIAKKIKESRLSEGNFSFEIPKKNFHLDENLWPTNYIIEERKDA